MTTEDKQREIIFRGKRVDNGEWVFGCLINNLWVNHKIGKPVCYIIPNELPNEKEYYYDCWDDVVSWIEDFEVVPETVGEFTSLKDKNNKEIYEGDVVKLSNSIRVMEVLKYSFWLVQKDGGNNKFPICMITEDTLNSLEIIGNIYENPELIANIKKDL